MENQTLVNHLQQDERESNYKKTFTLLHKGNIRGETLDLVDPSGWIKASFLAIPPHTAAHLYDHLKREDSREDVIKIPQHLRRGVETDAG